MINLRDEIINLNKDFKILWKYLNPYKKFFYRTSFFVLTASIIAAVIPLFLGKLVDVVQYQPIDLGLIFTILALWLFTSLIWAYLDKITFAWRNALGIDLNADLVYKTSSHIIKLPLSFHREKKIGETYKKVYRSGIFLSSIVADILFVIIPQFLTAIIGILILFSIHWQLGLGSFVFFIIIVIIVLYKTHPIISAQKKFNTSFERVTGNLFDSFLNAQTIKSCTLEEFQEQRTKKDYKGDWSPAFKDRVKTWNNLTLWQNILSAVGLVSLFGMAIFLLINENITIGGLIMFFAYFGLINEPLRQLSSHWRSFKIGMTTIERTEEILRIEEEGSEKENKILDKINGKIEFKNVSFDHKEKINALKNVSIVIHPEETIALVGESGGGKSTFVDLISFYFKAKEGEVLIDDVNIKDLNLKFLRENIAYVPQEIALFNDTIENNIRFGNMKASEEEIIEASKNANAHQFIEAFPDKYKQIVGERGIKLSTGQKQRIAIARALVRDPKILILDEATSALDSKSEKLIQDALEKLMRKRTTLIIAHRLSTIKKADKILVLDKGEIVEKGTHDALIKKKGLYFELYSLQSKKRVS